MANIVNVVATKVTTNWIILDHSVQTCPNYHKVDVKEKFSQNGSQTGLEDRMQLNLDWRRRKYNDNKALKYTEVYFSILKYRNRKKLTRWVKDGLKMGLNDLSLSKGCPGPPSCTTYSE